MRILNIKIYDKMMDLVGRDGTQIVGSRLHKILGFSDTYDSFVKRVRQARHTGLTRLEISIHADAISTYNPWQAKVKTVWHKIISRTMTYVATQVLLDKQVAENVCKALNFSSWICSISNVDINLMIIGRYQSWLVNAATVSKAHFVGTRRQIGLSCQGKRAASWKALADFA